MSAAVDVDPAACATLSELDVSAGRPTMFRQKSLYKSLRTARLTLSRGLRGSSHAVRRVQLTIMWRAEKRYVLSCGSLDIVRLI